MNITPLIIPILLYIIALSIVFRTTFVYEYRIKVLSKIRELDVFDASHPENVTIDIFLGNSNRRWKEFISVPVSKMVFQFWRPLDSFYPKDFLVEIGVKNETMKLRILSIKDNFDLSIKPGDLVELSNSDQPKSDTNPFASIIYSKRGEMIVCINPRKMGINDKEEQAKEEHDIQE